MAAPRVCVLRAPGTNCDIETAHAFDLCGGQAERVHLFRVLENPECLADYQILCIPGGFSYGDDVGAGVVFGSQLRGHLGQAIADFLQKDKLVLGICNGFQVLLKSGILPGGADQWPPTGDAPKATLTWNENGKYTALWVTLRVASEKNVFLRGIDRIEMPIAHAEGRFVTTSGDVLAELKQNGQIAACYEQADGDSTGEAGDAILPYPLNPNGSVANIAGIGDPSGRVLGLMPHPERFLFATQHPQWTRRGLRGDGDGRKLFQNAIDYFA
ncbi:MAG: phosphoribosylformylglycinamidine synthase I [Maioricimonas sp. JB045]